MTEGDLEERPRDVRRFLILCLVAIAAGVGIGFVGGGFRWCLDRVIECRDALVTWAHTLEGWGWIVPVVVTGIGAALAALTVRWVPTAVGSGIPHVEAVSRGEAAPPTLAVLPAKFIGGLLSIGSGLVLGREGPTVHMGAVIGTEAARLARRDDADVRLMQTSIGGAGLAVAFNAPIGGALFVFEEVTKSFRPRVIVPTLLGVAVAVGCARLIMGDGADFTVPEVPTPVLALLPAFAVFGILTGLLGALYNRIIVGSLDVVDRLTRIPAIVKAAMIGGLVGLALFIDPLTVGDGDSLSQLVLGGGTFAIPLLLVYFAVRFLAGPISYAAGTPGGLFAPLLAVGALWGVLFAWLVELVVPGQSLGIPMAIVGMAAFFGATVRAPLTGIVLVIEMTTITSVTVPMLVATGCALIAAMLVRSAPIYDTLRERSAASRH